MSRPNPKSVGVFGTRGLINPRARRRQVGSAEIAGPRLLRALGQAMNDRAAEREDDEFSEAAQDQKETGGLYAPAFDDGSGGGKQCIINEDGEIDCTGEPTGGASAYGGFGPDKGHEARSLGDMLIAMADSADKRKRRRQKTNKDLARFFEDRSTLGGHDAQLNLPLMQLVARYFDRRSQKVKSRRSRGDGYGYASL